MNSPSQLEQQLVTILDPSIFNTVEQSCYQELSGSGDAFQGQLLVQANPNEEFLVERYFELIGNYLTCYRTLSKNEQLYQINFNEIWKLYFDIEIYGGKNQFENQEEDQIFFIFFRCKKQFHLLYCQNLEEYQAWIDKLRPKCILSSFGNFYEKTKNQKKKLGINLYEFKRIADGQEVMVQVINLQQLKSSKNFEQIVISLKKEIIALQNLKHKNIIKLHEVYEGKSHLVLVFEKFQGQTMKQLQKQTLNLNDLEKISEKKQQIHKALTYLHANGISHSDIKPDYLIFRENNFDSDLVLYNFRLSQNLEQNHEVDFDALDMIFNQIPILETNNQIREI